MLAGVVILTICFPHGPLRQIPSASASDHDPPRGRARRTDLCRSDNYPTYCDSFYPLNIL